MNRLIFLDENLSPALTGPLSAVFRRGVTFRNAAQEHQGGVDDLDLIPYLGSRGFGLIVTQDRAQIDSNTRERDALRNAGLSWLGVPPPTAKGVQLLAEQVSVVAPTVGAILLDWPTMPTVYRLTPPRPPTVHVEPL